MPENIVVPWDLLGQSRDKFHIALDEYLQSTNCDDRVGYLEVVCLVQKSDDEDAIAEYRVTGGDAKIGLASMTSFGKDVDEPDDLPVINVRIQEFLEGLTADLKTYNTAEYSFRPGIRTLLYSANVGYSKCPIGTQCAYDSVRKHWYWHTCYLSKKYGCTCYWGSRCGN